MHSGQHQLGHLTNRASWTLNNEDQVVIEDHENGDCHYLSQRRHPINVSEIRAIGSEISRPKWSVFTLLAIKRILSFHVEWEPEFSSGRSWKQIQLVFFLNTCFKHTVYVCVFHDFLFLLLIPIIWKEGLSILVPWALCWRPHLASLIFRGIGCVFHPWDLCQVPNFLGYSIPAHAWRLSLASNN